DVELVAREAHAVLVADERLGADGEEHVVGVGVLLAHVVAVVGGHHADAVALRELLEHAVEAALLLEAVVLQLDEEVVAEDAQVAVEDALALLLAEVEDGAGDLRAQAARQGDDALVVLLEQLQVDARLHVEALEVGAAGELAEVLVALEVLGQQGEVEVAAVDLGGAAALLEARARRHVRLEADDWLDARGG